jgi:SSS family solute:Na+ symporter
MRITVLVFSVAVLAYAIRMQGTPIYELVSGAYQVPLVGAFVPLVCGLYWRRATTQGAVAAVLLGVGVWLVFLALPWGEAFPAQLAGVLAAFAGMFAGSLAPQWLADRRVPHRLLSVDPA